LKGIEAIRSNRKNLVSYLSFLDCFKVLIDDMTFKFFCAGFGTYK